MEEKSCIFDQFYRILNHDPWKYSGSGLKLTLIEKLVEQIAGAIAAESTIKNTCFTVKLAIAPQ
ncbi:ATP-binding protein [Nostoc sp. DedQUE09]|uniref:ATP-binding protein n=1 Tax=Nostoc sp. DedQUE09 TaxID=3075394 RepID=UPI002AD37FDE|nr:ATP-binding protein [Nostoc sp. DedQUE09]MDZ7951262.1 ATP-binding protein [Nostoc sp. DedQUE09]